MNDTPMLGLLHPVIITRDLERAMSYYCDVLGLVPRPITAHDPLKIARLGGPADMAGRAVILNAQDGSELEIACFTKPEGRAETTAGWQDAGIRSITFRVSNMATMMQRLSEAGYGIIGEVVTFELETGAVQVAYVEAPDGVVMTLLQDGAP
jgi:catechol 2,3-dioxygenase-like lactoylglutathione lyase family enzyme